jgi:hypothetical protein
MHNFGSIFDGASTIRLAIDLLRCCVPLAAEFPFWLVLAFAIANATFNGGPHIGQPFYLL